MKKQDSFSIIILLERRFGAVEVSGTKTEIVEERNRKTA